MILFYFIINIYMSETELKQLKEENERLKEKLKYKGETHKKFKFYIVKNGEEYKGYDRNRDKKLEECIKIFGYTSFEYGKNVIYRRSYDLDGIYGHHELLEKVKNFFKVLNDKGYKVVSIYENGDEIETDYFEWKRCYYRYSN